MVQKAGVAEGKGHNLAWGPPLYAGGLVKGEGTPSQLVLPGLDLTGTLCIQPPSYGAVTEATEEDGCPATMPCCP